MSLYIIIRYLLENPRRPGGTVGFPSWSPARLQQPFPAVCKGSDPQRLHYCPRCGSAPPSTLRAALYALRLLRDTEGPCGPFSRAHTGRALFAAAAFSPGQGTEAVVAACRPPFCSLSRGSEGPCSPLKRIHTRRATGGQEGLLSMPSPRVTSGSDRRSALLGTGHALPYSVSGAQPGSYPLSDCRSSKAGPLTAQQYLAKYLRLG